MFLKTLKLVGIKDETLRAIKHHLLTEGLVEQQHGNMKKLSKVTSRVTINQELAIILSIIMRMSMDFPHQVVICKQIL